jgi:hypothetical protein
LKTIYMLTAIMIDMCRINSSSSVGSSDWLLAVLAEQAATKPSLPVKAPQQQQQQQQEQHQQQQQQQSQQLPVPVIDLTSHVVSPARAIISNSISSGSSKSNSINLDTISSIISSSSNNTAVPRPDSAKLFADLKSIVTARRGISQNVLVGGTFLQLQNREPSHIQLLQHQQQQRTAAAAARLAADVMAYKRRTAVTAATSTATNTATSTATAAKAAIITATSSTAAASKSSNAGVAKPYSDSATASSRGSLSRKSNTSGPSLLLTLLL